MGNAAPQARSLTSPAAGSPVRDILPGISIDTQQAHQMLGRFADQVPADQQAEVAALTVVANVILNLDEFLTH